MAVKHTFLGKNGHETKMLNPLMACRQKCLECSAWQIVEVTECPAKDCALFPFRFGKDPGRKKRVLSEEELETLRERLILARGKRQEST